MRKGQGSGSGSGSGQGAVHETSSRASSSCAACKLLKRRCSKDCIFAPYFRADEPKKFAKVHKVFGASNVSKILHEVPVEHRHDAVLSLSYEAEARLLDPVYGCLGPIALLQHRMAQLQSDLALARARLAGVAAFHHAPPPTPPLLLPVEEEEEESGLQQPIPSSVGPVQIVPDQQVQMYADLPLMSNEVVCDRYEGVFVRDEVDHNVPMWPHESGNNSALLSQSSSGCYDNNDFGRVSLLPL